MTPVAAPDLRHGWEEAGEKRDRVPSPGATAARSANGLIPRPRRCNGATGHGHPDPARLARLKDDPMAPLEGTE